MPVQSSGPISLNDLHTEAGGTSGTLCSINDQDIRDMIGKGSGAQASLSEYYGASATLFDASSDLPVYGRWRTAYGGNYGSIANFSSSNYDWDLRGQQSSTCYSVLYSDKMLDRTVGGAHAGKDLKVTYDFTLDVDGSWTNGYVRLYGRKKSSNNPSTGGVSTTQASVPGSILRNLGNHSGNQHGSSIRYTNSVTFTPDSGFDGYYSQLGIYVQNNPPGNNPPAWNSYWVSLDLHSLTVEVV